LRARPGTDPVRAVQGVLNAVMGCWAFGDFKGRKQRK
jgi:hypothetical protein